MLMKVLILTIFFTMAYSYPRFPNQEDEDQLLGKGLIALLAAAQRRPTSGKVKVQFAKRLMDAVAQADCNSHCQSGGNGNGVVIGTAPFCGGDCSSDCRSDNCMPWPDSCWTGNKICCCAK